MIKVKRIRHVTFVTPDIDRQIDYYQTVVGLGVVTRDASRASLATDSGRTRRRPAAWRSGGLSAIDLRSGA